MPSQPGKSKTRGSLQPASQTVYPNGTTHVQAKDSASKRKEEDNWRGHPMPISALYTCTHIQWYEHACVCMSTWTHIQYWEHLLGTASIDSFTLTLYPSQHCSVSSKTKLLRNLSTRYSMFQPMNGTGKRSKGETQWSLDTVQQVTTGCLHPCLEGCLPLGSSICDMNVSLSP